MNSYSTLEILLYRISEVYYLGQKMMAQGACFIYLGCDVIWVHVAVSVGYLKGYTVEVIRFCFQPPMFIHVVLFWYRNTQALSIVDYDLLYEYMLLILLAAPTHHTKDYPCS
jgi:hypothetical protein